MSEAISKLGIHCKGDRRAGYGEFLRRVADSGRALAGVKCRDNFGAIDEPLRLWPDMLTIGAFTHYDRLPFVLSYDWPRFCERARLNPKIKYWEILNEDDGHWQDKANLYIELLPLMVAQGWGLCAWNCGSGNPPYFHEDAGMAYTQILRVARFARANNYPLMIGVHGYGFDAKHCLLRYRDLANYLRENDALVPFALTEFGDTEAGFRGVNEFVDWCRIIDAELMRDGYLKFAALWTLGGGWNDFSPALYRAWNGTSSLGDYLATVEIVDAPPLPRSRRVIEYNAADTKVRNLCQDNGIKYASIYES